MIAFEDYFSQNASNYALYRPHYPADLFTYLSSIAPHRRLAWDSGTGSGQAAAGLAGYFERVVATDASADQIAHAFPHERVEYRVEPAEEPDLKTGSVDLITVATAVHWFDLARFYDNVRRVAVPGGILAVWTYHTSVIAPEIDAVLDHYYREILADYWPERWRYIDEHYQTLPFPFTELLPPAFQMQANWSLDELVGYLSSWSAGQRYAAARGHHPLSVIWSELAAAWGDPQQRRKISWPLYMRIGRVG